MSVEILVFEPNLIPKKNTFNPRKLAKVRHAPNSEGRRAHIRAIRANKVKVGEPRRTSRVGGSTHGFGGKASRQGCAWCAEISV